MRRAIPIIMMKILAVAILMFASNAVYAQGSPSPDTAAPQAASGPVLHAAGDDTNASRLDVEIGAVRLTTHSGRYTMAYLPFLAPLPGTSFRSSMVLPNALALTGTTIPQRPHRRSFALVESR